jgi:hypothetical protein
VAELAEKAGIPKPRIGISQLNMPNAFAFGKSLRDGRVCVTEGIRGLLSKNELKAVQTRPDGLGMKSCTSTAKKLVHTTRLIKVGRKQLGHTDYYEQFTEDLKEA